MDSEQKIVACSVLVAVSLNIVASFVLLPYIPNAHKNATDGVSKLTAQGKFNHLLYTNTEIPLLSSVFLAGVIYISVFIGMNFVK